MSNPEDSDNLSAPESTNVNTSAKTRSISRRLSAKLRPMSVEESLFQSGHEFDFFQAVQILESLSPDCPPIGEAWGQPAAVRFAANSGSSSFAASSVYEVQPTTGKMNCPKMIVGFMGLTGPSGMLPQHYTEILHRIEIEARGPNKFALRDWFDLFNDRLISLFYRSWKKYRPFATYAQALQGKSDTFSSALQSIAGLGMPGLNRQIHKFVPRWNLNDSSDPITQESSQRASESCSSETAQKAVDEAAAEETSAKSATSTQRPPLELALLRYAGLLAQRPRCVANLQNLLEDYFELPFQIKQFHGNWLALDDSSQTRLGLRLGNSVLGETAVVGNQTWERQNKILICIGPLTAQQFEQFLPGYESEFQDNDYTLLTELVRLFAGPEVEFDIRLDIKGQEVKPAQLTTESRQGLRLGWNCWLSGTQAQEVVSDSYLCCL